MGLLERACDAAPFMMYGMDLTQGNGFDAVNDPFIITKWTNRASVFTYME